MPDRSDLAGELEERAWNELPNALARLERVYAVEPASAVRMDLVHQYGDSRGFGWLGRTLRKIRETCDVIDAEAGGDPKLVVRAVEARRAADAAQERAWALAERHRLRLERSATAGSMQDAPAISSRAAG